MMARTSGLALDTWIQAAAALFAAIAAGAAWAATHQVKMAGEEERRLLVWAHLKTIHGLVSQLARTHGKNPKDWQGPQLDLRAEAAVVFHPLPKVAALADANLWGDITVAAFDELAREAMAEVESALHDVWKDTRRWSWLRRRPRVSRTYPAAGPESTGNDRDT
jgi:hypothetical protein